MSLWASTSILGRRPRHFFLLASSMGIFGCIFEDKTFLLFIICIADTIFWFFSSGLFTIDILFSPKLEELLFKVYGLTIDRRELLIVALLIFLPPKDELLLMVLFCVVSQGILVRFLMLVFGIIYAGNCARVEGLLNIWMDSFLFEWMKSFISEFSRRLSCSGIDSMYDINFMSI